MDIKVQDHITYGKILTDKEGRTLYYFSLDTKGTSACADKCVEYWPIFYKENPTIGNGLEKSDFGSITRADGSMQTTFKGWPLYYYVEDKLPLEAKGEAVNDIWFVAKPDYTVMYVQAQLVGADGKNYMADYSLGDEKTFYMTDASGRTLYAFEMDKKDQNNYTKDDFSNNALWPIYICDKIGSVPSIFSKKDFGIINVFGKNQVTFRGWPLYYFEEDTQRGDNKGISVPKPGVWPIVNNTTPEAKSE